MWLKQCAFSLMNVTTRVAPCAEGRYLPLLSRPVRRFRTTTKVNNSGKLSHSFDGLDPFGKIILRNDTRYVINYAVTCINPRDYPDQDKAFTTVSHDNVIDCQLENNVLSVNARAESHVDKTAVDCQIQVPVKFDIIAELSGASSISISNFENRTVTVALQEGRCILSNIQSDKFHISSNNGAIVSEKLLQGNGVITTNGGLISLHKVLSQVLHVQSQTGDVNISNLYANNSKILTEKGNVHIVNSHMDTDVMVRQHGNVKIDSVSGNLNADVHHGDVIIMISEHDKINLSTGKGDITISLPRTSSAALEMKAAAIEIDEELLLKNVLEEKRNGLELLDATVEGTATHRTTIGRISASASDGTIKLLSSSDGWLSMVKENITKK